MSDYSWGLTAEEWAAALERSDCATCGDSGEVWDGWVREPETGMPHTAPCPHCDGGAA